MKPWDRFAKAVSVIIGVTVIAFNILLYSSFEEQKAELNSLKDKQNQIDSLNKDLTVTQQQMESLSKDSARAQQQIEGLSDDLKDVQQQIKNQKETMLQEIKRRQAVENEGKYTKVSLLKVKAGANAIKQDMKSWQRDYITILVQLQKKTDDAQHQIKSFEDNFTAFNIPQLKENLKSLENKFEEMTQPVDNTVITAPAAVGQPTH